MTGVLRKETSSGHRNSKVIRPEVNFFRKIIQKQNSGVIKIEGKEKKQYVSETDQEKWDQKDEGEIERGLN